MEKDLLTAYKAYDQKRIAHVRELENQNKKLREELEKKDRRIKDLEWVTEDQAAELEELREAMIKPHLRNY